LRRPGFPPSASPQSIFTQGDTGDGLRANVREAIEAFYFDCAAFYFDCAKPHNIRLHLVRDEMFALDPLDGTFSWHNVRSLTAVQHARFVAVSGRRRDEHDTQAGSTKSEASADYANVLLAMYIMISLTAVPAQLI